MISNNSPQTSAEPQAQQPQAEAGKVAPALDPRTPIEVASTGTGTMNDPAGSDNKPPNAYDLDLLA
ncbi:MAG TPA: hypothetical protein VH988_21990 [Thermoanaerobaculia bacterium]|nr:hypothetical protein [Thermoanaerobaculia bacterium]